MGNFWIWYATWITVALVPILIWTILSAETLYCTQETKIWWVHVVCDAPDIFNTDTKIKFIINDMNNFNTKNK